MIPLSGKSFTSSGGVQIPLLAFSKMQNSTCKSQILAQDAIERTALVSSEPKQLGFVDRYLTAWIFGAMFLGVIIGASSPSSVATVNSWSTGGVNWPIAIGLIVMMFPPLARVNYDEVWKILTGGIFLPMGEMENSFHSLIDEVTLLLKVSDPKCGKSCLCHSDPNYKAAEVPTSVHRSTGSQSQKNQKFQLLLAFSIFMNWVVGPFLMFFLALMWLPDQIPYIRGLIMVGLARCIAMVIVWNDLANGSPEYAAILVCFNSVFQIVFYSTYAYLFISVFLAGCNLPNSGNEQVRVLFSFVFGIHCFVIDNSITGQRVVRTGSQERGDLPRHSFRHWL